MDSEILLIALTLIMCAFFIALIRLVLRCADETEAIDYVGMAQVIDEKQDYETV